VQSLAEVFHGVTLKMQDRKMQDWKMADHIAGDEKCQIWKMANLCLLEFEGLENAGPEKYKTN